MDISAWLELHRKDDPTATAAWQKLLMRLSPPQRPAVWAWHRPDPFGPPGTHRDGPLAGVPFVAKDLFPYRGTPTRAGGILRRPPARRTSHLISRLESLGATLAAKTHLHEFAYGLTGENPHYGDVEHPHHAGRTAGGSSSGSAAAVAAGIAPFALGTDTAGSLRVPAAYCGLYSWRGQPGEPDITDAFPLAPSFDTAGWLTATLADCATLWRLLHADPVPAAPAPLRGAYLPASALGLSGPAETRQTLDATAARFTDLALDETTPLAQVARGVGDTYSILQSTEAYAVHQATLDAERAAYGTPVWQRIDRGRRWTVAQLDAARHHALRIRAAYDTFFATFDFLITPVTLTPAPLTSDNRPEIRETLLALNTHVSIAGRPALSIPVHVEGDLSVGLQIVFASSRSPAIHSCFARCETCLPAAS